MTRDADPQDDVAALAAATRAQVEHQRRLGVPGWPRRAADVAPRAASASTTAQPSAAAPPPPAVPVPVMTPPDLLLEPAVAQARSLDELCSAIGECTRCKLAGGRTQIVFGV